MDFVKAKEILRTIEELDPDSKETILNALKIALHIEETSKGFYEKQVEKNSESELKPFFEFLVREEEMHLKKILELKKELEETTDFSGREITFESSTPPNITAIPSGQNELTTILYALWREKKAVDFYQEAANKTRNSVKKFFEELADFEREHVNLLEGILEDAQNTGELIMG